MFGLTTQLEDHIREQKEERKGKGGEMEGRRRERGKEVGGTKARGRYIGGQRGGEIREEGTLHKK
jgi:hypothetical protein